MKIQKNISNSNSFLDNFSKKSNSSFINNSNNLNLSPNKNNISNNNNFRENIKNKFEEAMRYLDSFSNEDSIFNAKNNLHFSRNSIDEISNLKKNYFFNSLNQSYKILPLNNSRDNQNFLSPKCKSKIIQIYENSQKRKKEEILNQENNNNNNNDNNNNEENLINEENNNKQKLKKAKKINDIYNLLGYKNYKSGLKNIKEDEESYVTYKIQDYGYKNLKNFIRPNLINQNLVQKINPHVDLYDNKNKKIKEITKSASVQRLNHMTNVINSTLFENNNDNFLNHILKLNNNKNSNKNIFNKPKDLFAMDHKTKINNKMVDLNHFSIFPDINRRKKKDDLLMKYANNNLNIISGIKKDLNQNETGNYNEPIKINDKIIQPKKVQNIDIVKDISIDELV